MHSVFRKNSKRYEKILKKNTKEREVKDIDKKLLNDNNGKFWDET